MPERVFDRVFPDSDGSANGDYPGRAALPAPGQVSDDLQLTRGGRKGRLPA